MLRRAGTLLAKQLSQTRSYSNKARLYSGMLPLCLLLYYFPCTYKTERCAVGALWASVDLERARRHLPACSGFQARHLLSSLFNLLCNLTAVQLSKELKKLRVMLQRQRCTSGFWK